MLNISTCQSFQAHRVSLGKVRYLPVVRLLVYPSLVRPQPVLTPVLVLVPLLVLWLVLMLR